MMKNFTLTTLSTFSLIICISILFTFQPSIVLASNAQGNQDSDLSDFKKQLELMEETIKKQQERINALEDKIESKEKVVSNHAPTYLEENEIEQIVDTYLTKIETSSNMTNPGLPTQMGVYWDNGLRFKSEDGNFKFKLGGRIMNDWGWSTEDKDILDNIGDQVDGTEFRRARIYLSGDIYENIGFMAQYDFASVGRPDLKNVYIKLKKIPVLGNFQVGHFREPFGLEGLTSSKYITFMERSLNDVFVPVRNTGFMLYNHALDERMTWATGVFRNADGFGDSEGNRRSEGGYSFSGRITGLPWYMDNGKKLVHTGFSYSHQNAFADDTLETGFQYVSKPEIHLASDFVDTGRFTADFANLYNPELAIVYGPFTLQTEYTFTDINRKRTTVGSTDFNGFYVYGSYFLTGESRKYDTKNGKFSRVKPIKNFSWGKGLGAIELALRYSELDLSDKDVKGGKLNDVTVGLNWHLNPNTRIMLNYVHADADLTNTGNIKDGNADLVAMRFQIDF